MKKYRIILLIALLPLFISCVGQSIQQEDPIKAALYTAKESWISIREHVINNYINGDITEETYNEFKGLDSQFQKYYDAAHFLYLQGKENSGEFDKNMDSIRDILLDARKKYYKGGN